MSSCGLSEKFMHINHHSEFSLRISVLIFFREMESEYFGDSPAMTRAGLSDIRRPRNHWRGWSGDDLTA